MLAELSADRGGNFEGKRTGACLLSPSPARVSHDDLQQLLVASRGVAILVLSTLGAGKSMLVCVVVVLVREGALVSPKGSH